jgi:hypothetical protein
VDFWGVPHPSLPAEAFPMANRLRASIVGVPVHQQLRDRDLERIVTAVRQWNGRTRTPGSPRPSVSDVRPASAPGQDEEQLTARRRPHGNYT